MFYKKMKNIKYIRSKTSRASNKKHKLTKISTKINNFTPVTED